MRHILHLFKRVKKRTLILLLSAIVLVSGALSATVAILVTRTDTADNTFSPPHVRITLRDYDEITNIGNVPVYVRALAVVNWMSLEDEHTIHAVKPKVGQDLEITFITENWFLASDGFYYYKKPIQPGEHVALVYEAYQLTEKDGFKMELEILSSSIQASDEAIDAAWPAVRINESGELEKVPEGGAQ